METQQQIDPTVVVSEAAVAKLAAYLKEVGRLHGGPGDVRTQLNRACALTWGRAGKSVQFTDGAGPGWILDLSDHFDSQMLYGVVRSQMGTRQVVAVVDVDEVEQFHATKQWQSPEALGEVDPNRTKELMEQATPSAPAPASAPAQVPAPARGPEDPCLVAYWHKPDIGSREDGDYSKDGIIRCLRSEVPGHISRLLQEGVEEGDIEVWSAMSKPKVKIAF